MHISLDCPGCGRRLRVNEQFAGRTVRCPSCGTPYTAPGPRDDFPARDRPPFDDAPGEDLYAPCEGCGVLVCVPEGGGPARCAGCRDRAATEPYRLADSGPEEAVFVMPQALSPVHVTPAAEPPPPSTEVHPTETSAPRHPAPAGPPCPECGAEMAGDAVVCIACGFNRATGKRLRTVSRRIARRWDSGNFPLAARLVVFAVVVAACFLPLLTFPDNPETLAEFLLIPVAGAALGALVLGTFHRVTVTTDAQGTPILLQNGWVCFFPTSETPTDLTDFRTIRLAHHEGSLSGLGLLLAIGLCFLGGIPAILWRAHLLRHGVYTLEIVSRLDPKGAPLLEPVKVYHGRSESMARGIADALEQLADLRYG